MEPKLFMITMSCLIILIVSLLIYYLRTHPKTVRNGILIEKEVKIFPGMIGKKVTIIYIIFRCDAELVKLQVLDHKQGEKLMEGDYGEIISIGGFLIKFTIKN